MKQKRNPRGRAENRRSGRRLSNKKNRKIIPPETTEESFAMPEGSQERWIAITNTITKSRVYDISIPKAARAQNH
jgi:hypothetical protein